MATDRRRVLTLAGLGLLFAGVLAALHNQSASSGSTTGTGTTTGSWPAGWPPPGSLVNPHGQYVGDLSQAWVIGSDQHKHAVPSFAVFQQCHMPGGVVVPIDPALLAKIPQGADVAYPACWPPVCGPAATAQRVAWHIAAPSVVDCPNG